MHKLMMGLARTLAIVGGIVLSLLILLTCVSILGRLLNGVFHGGFMQSVAPGFAKWALDMGVGPVNGDFELVEAGVAFAIFCFLPLCQITAGHASVDILANTFSARVNRFLRMVTEIVFAAVLVLIAWKLFDGMMSKKEYGETTFLLQFPIWWAYALSFVASLAAAIVGLYMAGVRTVEFYTGRILIWDGVEATH
ncbi:C4-dicarboxylate ABC transporter permease [Ruegeria marisrubri]|uniref:TRAP transporter small permease protein n=1 Tax=Ruegeria marisrubri TaxID=1685379 RepID=A0A0X3TBS8_9RHOB|nr:TRAP transporter small permease [Ruegeria marisrubri]KUJ73244.1 C4-dicarboxylate ABC transporter permease [Ruegeria marisrubri]